MSFRESCIDLNYFFIWRCDQGTIIIDRNYLEKMKKNNGKTRKKKGASEKNLSKIIRIKCDLLALMPNGLHILYVFHAKCLVS